MKKLLSIIIMGAVIANLICVPVFALEATPTASTVYVDGVKVNFDAYLIEGNNYFKLRDLAFALSGTSKQFDVGYDEVSNSIKLTSGKPYIVVGGEMSKGGSVTKTPIPTDSAIIKDGVSVKFTAYVIDDNNYFKLRDIGEAFNFNVEWDGENSAITIDTSKNYGGENSTPFYSNHPDVPDFGAIFNVPIDGFASDSYAYDLSNAERSIMKKYDIVLIENGFTLDSTGGDIAVYKKGATSVELLLMDTVLFVMIE